MAKNKNQILIDGLRSLIKPIAFDANLYDLGLADYPHAQHCSEKRKKYNAEIVRLGGVPKPLPFQKAKPVVEVEVDQPVTQLSMFDGGEA